MQLAMGRPHGQVRPLASRGRDPTHVAIANAAIAGLLAVALGGCAAPEEPRLVALLGCGLDVADDEDAPSVFTELRVEARGDFPLMQAQSVAIGDTERLLADPSAIAGVTVEGIVDDAVTAVGRTARVAEAGDLAVYFAPVDQWCAVGSAIGLRDPGAIAVGGSGDVLVVGGRDLDGFLIDDVVHLRDDTGVATTLPDALPVPSTGHSVHAVGPSGFVVVGGASVNPTPLASLVRVAIEPGGATVGDPVAIDLPASASPGRAYHGAVTLPDGDVFVAGGCSALDLAARCIPQSDPVLGDPVLMSSYRLSIDELEVRAEVAPPLFVPRYDHQLHVGRDGVVFAAGGRSLDDAPVLQPERLLVDAPAFEPYGPPLHAIGPADPDASCAGATPAAELAVEGSVLLEGGMVVLAFSDGTLRWITATETGCFRRWCIDGGSCFDRPPGDPPAFVSPARSLLLLPGERVLADAFILPIGGRSMTGDDAIPLGEPTLDNPLPPPGQRTGARMAVLADGSALVSGGRDPTTGDPAQPFFVRLRPALDGPDEQVPDVVTLSRGSMLAMQPDRIVSESEDVRLLAVGAAEEFPSVRARARAFVSTSFRFEVRLENPGDAVPHIVLERGAVAATSIAFEPTQIRAYVRDATGASVGVTCATIPSSFATPQVMRIDVDPTTIRVRRAGEEIAQCPGPGETASAVGVGATGSGTVVASQMRLTRI